MNIVSIDSILKKAPAKKPTSLEEAVRALSSGESLKPPPSTVSKGSLKSAVKKASTVKPKSPQDLAEGRVMPEGYNVSAKSNPGTLEGAMAQWDKENPNAPLTVRDEVKYRIQSMVANRPKTEEGYRAMREGNLLNAFNIEEQTKHRIGADRAYNQASGEALAEIGSNIDKSVGNVLSTAAQGASSMSSAGGFEDEHPIAQVTRGAGQGLASLVNPVDQLAMLYQVSNAVDNPEQFKQLGEGLVRPVTVWFDPKATYEDKGMAAVQLAGLVLGAKAGLGKLKIAMNDAAAAAAISKKTGLSAGESLRIWKEAKKFDPEFSAPAEQAASQKGTAIKGEGADMPRIENAPKSEANYTGRRTAQKPAEVPPVQKTPKPKKPAQMQAETANNISQKPVNETQQPKPLTGETKQPSKVKEPWEMTRNESVEEWDSIIRAKNEDAIKRASGYRKPTNEGKYRPKAEAIRKELEGRGYKTLSIDEASTTESIYVRMEGPNGEIASYRVSGHSTQGPTQNKGLRGKTGPQVDVTRTTDTIKAVDAIVKRQVTPKSSIDIIGPSHEKSVQQAVTEGKPVPDNVLNEYKGTPWADAEIARRNSKEIPNSSTVIPENAPNRNKQTVIDGSENKPAVDLPVKEAITPENPVEPRATGLANQVQVREAEAGLIKAVESTKGATREGIHEQTKTFLDSNPDFNYSKFSADIAEGKVPFDLEGAVKANAGKIKLSRDVDALGKKLDADPSNGKLRAEYKLAQSKLDDYAQNIQVGKGAWHDVGMALQEGAYVDDASFADVIQRAKREKYYDPNDKGYHEDVKLLTDELATVKEQLKESELKTSELQKKLEEGKRIPKTKDIIERAQKKRSDALSELKRMWDSGEFAQTQAGAGVGGFSPAYAKAVKLGVDILMSYIEQGAATVVEALGKTMDHMKEIGIDVAEQDIVDQFQAKPKPPVSEAKQKILVLKKELQSLTTKAKEKTAQAKAESAEVLANRKKLAVQDIKAQIAELEADIKNGVYELKKGKSRSSVSPEVELLKAKKYRLEQAVRAKIKELESPKSVRAAQDVAGLVRGIQLGSDVGTVLRQGAFGVSNPKQMARSLARAWEAAKSDDAFDIQMHRIRNREINGKPAMLVEKKAGLQITDTLIKPEEIIVGKYLKRFPRLGKTLGARLERFQVAYINSLRAELFDRAATKGLNDAELRDVAHFINNVTGRGNMEFLPEQLQKTLNIVMTSPRYEASRWGTIMEPGRNLAKLGRKVDGKWVWNKGAIENFKMMGKQAALGVAIIELAKQLGFEIDTDPNSPDFMKLRRGGTVFDFTAGLVPRARDVIRGAYIWGTGGDYKNNESSLLGKAVTRPISPAVRLPLTLGSEAIQRYGLKKPVEDVKDPFSGMDMEKENMGWRMALPLVISSTIDAGQQDGFWTGVGAFGAELLGGGVNTYEKKQPKEKTKRHPGFIPPPRDPTKKYKL